MGKEGTLEINLTTILFSAGSDRMVSLLATSSPPQGGGGVGEIARQKLRARGFEIMVLWQWKNVIHLEVASGILMYVK